MNWWEDQTKLEQVAREALRRRGTSEAEIERLVRVGINCTITSQGIVLMLGPIENQVPGHLRFEHVICILPKKVNGPGLGAGIVIGQPVQAVR